MAETTIKNFLLLPFKKLDMQLLIGEAMQEKDEQIMDLNKQQLDRGLDATDDSLGRYKNFKYKNRFQPVDLLLTGDFRKKFTLAPGKKSAEIFSQDQKSTFLEKRYGKDIFGISSNVKDNVAAIIKDPLGVKVKTKLLNQ
ncbi:MAG: hypothetical protein WCG90_08205 [Chitinophagia bacterium]